MSGQAAGHRFVGMDREPNVPPMEREKPGPYRYRGRCACGHAEHWTTDKDWAWEEIADHLLPALRAVLTARRSCLWCEYGRCADCLWLTAMFGASPCGCPHPGLA